MLLIRTTLEFKQSFGFRSLPEYARTLAAFANNRGGYIVFGVTNSPRHLEGIKRESFEAIDPAKLAIGLNEYFEPSIDFDVGLIEIQGVCAGYLYAHEARAKPIICRKASHPELRPGEVYFRYHAHTKPIAHAELRAMFDASIAAERALWMKHLESIARIGPKNVAFLDLARGDLTTLPEQPKLVVDKELLAEMQKGFVFLREGDFSQAAGAPALVVRGSLTPAETTVVADVTPEKNYPFIARELAARLNVNSFDIQVLVWHFKLKEDPRYATKVRFGMKAETVKYTEEALRKLSTELSTQTDKAKFLAAVKAAYAKRTKGA